MKLQRICTLAAGAVLALAACDDSTGSDDFGTFDAEVTGDLDLSLSGSAISGGSAGFTHDLLALQDFGADADIVFVNVADDFSEGVWSIEDASVSDPSSGVAAGIFVGSRAFIATDGVIDIDGESSSGLEGSFEFEAVEVDPDTDEILDDVVFVQGVFSSDFQSTLSRGPAAQITRLGKGRLR